MSLSRRYRFSAAHVLARPDWPDARNREVYGKCANAAGHGHNYELWVTLRGEPDPATGWLLPLEQLDALVAEVVLRPLDGALLNRDVPAFRADVPTAENIARFAWRALARGVRPAALERVRLVETANNSVEYAPGSEVA